MYARVTKTYVNTSRIEEARKLLGEIKPAVEQVEGLQFWFATADEESGEGITIAIYDTKESAGAAAGTARQLMGSFSELFTQAPEVAEYDVEEFWVR